MEPKIKFEFTLNEANTILAALGKAPYEAVAGLVDNIRAQAAPQIEPPQQESANGLKTKNLPN